MSIDWTQGVVSDPTPARHSKTVELMTKFDTEWVNLTGMVDSVCVRDGKVYTCPDTDVEVTNGNARVLETWLRSKVGQRIIVEQPVTKTRKQRNFVIRMAGKAGRQSANVQPIRPTVADLAPSVNQ
jgi:hypothetical protein